MEAIYTFDYAILNWVQATLKSETMDGFMLFFTFLSEYGIFWIIVAATMLFFKNTRKIGLSIGVAMIIGLIFGNGVLKNLFARLRPYDPNGPFAYMMVEVELLVKTPWDFSFPSGHTLSAIEAATVLMIWNKRYGIPTFVVAALVGLSRVYLYVHYPTDVLASCLLGIVCGIFGYLIVHLYYDRAEAFVLSKIKPKKE